MDRILIHWQGAALEAASQIDAIGMSEWLHRIYPIVPDRLDRALMQLVRLARRSAARKVAVERISGCTPPSNNRLSAIAVGRTPSLDYFLQSLFAGQIDYGTPVDVSWRKIPELIRAERTSDICFVRCDRTLPVGLSLTCEWRIPDAVASIIELSGSGRPAPGQRGNADNLRRIRKHGLYATISRDPVDFADFYRNAYLPFVSARFGSLGIARSQSRLARYFRQGGLLWVERNGVRLAAMLFSLSRPVAKSQVIAPLSNQPQAAKLGAIGATYKFLIDLAIAENCATVDLGVSRPNLLDGVLIHKKHWGAQLTEAPELGAEIRLSWKSFTPDIAEWLFRTPVIVRDNDSLSALTALRPGATAAECRRHLHRLSSPGLGRILVISTPDRAPAITSINGLDVHWLNPEPC